MLCLALAGTPATAQQISLFSTDGPQAVGPQIGGGQTGPTDITDVSWICSFSNCDVTSVSVWLSQSNNFGVSPSATSNWLVSGHVPFDFKGGASGMSTITPEGCVGIFCEVNISFGRGIDQGGGVNWINLYTFDNDKVPGNINWATSAEATPLSSTLILSNTTGVITPFPNALAFEVFGTPTTTPEPGTILMLGSGLLGVAGVLRRKLML